MQKTDKEGFQINKIHGRGMTDGVRFISALFFFLLLTTGAYAAEMICSDCHGTPHGATCDSVNCSNCHTNKLPMNHPTGPNTPLVDLSTAAGITQACISCHAAGGASHPFRINLDVNNPNSYPDVDVVCGQCHGGSGTAKAGIVQLTPGQLSVFGTNIHYRITPRTASYAWSVDGTVSDKVNFDASASACGAAPCTYAWNFGDGSIVSASAVTSHQYPARGSYPAIVTVTDNNGVMNMSPAYNITTIRQNTAPTAVMLAPVVSGMTATISDRSTDAEDAPGAMTVTVNCGNNTVKTGPDHTDLVCTYTTAGTYTIKHSVKDTGGLGSSSANTSVTVGSTSSRYSVSGTLTKQNGTPIGGGYIYLQLAGVNKYIAISAATTGNFTVNNVVPGTYTVKATKTGLTFTTPAESIPSPIVVGSSNVTGVVVKSIQ